MVNENMRVLLTGGAGYIGSVMAESFLRAGWNVRVLDNLMYDQFGIADLCAFENFQFVYGDIRDLSLVREELKSADVVVPLAGIVGAPACSRDEKLATEVNLVAPTQMFEMLSKDQLIIMPTTNSAYGTTIGLDECDETSPLNPISKYARDKVTLEERLMALENAISFRLATVFGASKRMRLDLLVNNFVHRSVKDGYLAIFEGHYVRNYIHIRDVVSAFELAISRPNDFCGEIFNVGLSTANITKLELANRIKEFLPSLVIMESAIGQDPDKRNYRVSNKKIEAKGFYPKFSLNHGIRELLAAMPFFRVSDFSNV